MALQVITPVRVQEPRQEQTKKESTLDKILKGLQAAKAATGIAVDIQSFRKMGAELEPVQIKNQAMKDIAEGKLTEKVRQYAPFSGGVILDYSRLEDKFKAGTLEAPRGGIVSEGLGIEEPVVKKGLDQQELLKILDVYEEQTKKMGLTSKELNKILRDPETKQFSRGGIDYIIGKRKLPKFLDMPEGPFPGEDFKTAEGRDEYLKKVTKIISDGEPGFKSLKERKKFLGELDQLMDYTQPFMLPVGISGTEPDPSKEKPFWMKDTDVVLRQGNKRYAFTNFLPAIENKLKRAEYAKKMGLSEALTTSEKYNAWSSSLDKFTDQLQQMWSDDDIKSASTTKKALQGAMEAAKSGDTVQAITTLVYALPKTASPTTGVTAADIAAWLGGDDKGSFANMFGADMRDYINKEFRKQMINDLGWSAKKWAKIKEGGIKSIKEAWNEAIKNKEFYHRGMVRGHTLKNMRDALVNFHRAAYSVADQKFNQRMAAAKNSLAAKWSQLQPGMGREWYEMAANKHASAFVTPGLVPDEDLDKFLSIGAAPSMLDIEQEVRSDKYKGTPEQEELKEAFPTLTKGATTTDDSDKLSDADVAQTAAMKQVPALAESVKPATEAIKDLVGDVFPFSFGGGGRDDSAISGAAGPDLQAKFNEFLNTKTPEQREQIVDLIKRARTQRARQRLIDFFIQGKK